MDMYVVPYSDTPVQLEIDVWTSSVHVSKHVTKICKFQLWLEAVKLSLLYMCIQAFSMAV